MTHARANIKLKKLCMPFISFKSNSARNSHRAMERGKKRTGSKVSRVGNKTVSITLLLNDFLALPRQHRSTVAPWQCCHFLCECSECLDFGSEFESSVSVRMKSSFKLFPNVLNWATSQGSDEKVCGFSMTEVHAMLIKITGGNNNFCLEFQCQFM